MSERPDLIDPDSVRLLISGEPQRQKILEAAKGLFLERGVRQTSIQDILEAAGVSRSAFDLHFSDKTELLGNLYRQVLEDRLSDFSEITSGDMSPWQKIDRISQVLGTELEEERDIIALFHRTVPEQVVKRYDLLLSERLFPALTGIVNEGIHAGVMDVDFPEVTIFQVLAMIKRAIALTVLYDLPLEMKELSESFRLICYKVLYPHGKHSGSPD